MADGRIVDTRWWRSVLRAVFLIVVFTFPITAFSAGHRTANFIVDAPAHTLAQRIGEAAEQYRHDLAMEWLGKPLPRWSRPCPITA